MNDFFVVILVGLIGLLFCSIAFIPLFIESNTNDCPKPQQLIRR